MVKRFTAQVKKKKKKVANCVKKKKNGSTPQISLIRYKYLAVRFIFSSRLTRAALCNTVVSVVRRIWLRLTGLP